MNKASRTEPEADSYSYFVEWLPRELQLCVFPFLDDVADASSLCLAVPPLGLAAIRSRAELQGPLFAIAMRLASVPGSILDEDLLRKYANDPHADATHSLN